MEKKFTVDEIRKYIESQDSLGDVAYHLNEDNIIKANKPEPSERVDAIQECIETLQKIIRPNCHDHTPYRGVCTSCGQYDNPDFIDPDEAIRELELLKSLEK